MDNKDVHNTILSEYRRVIGSRYFLAVLNFIAVLLGSVATLTFVIKRGSAPIMQIYLYALIAINVAQIAMCIADYILKTRFGLYVKQLTLASYIVAGVWLIMLIVELITGTLDAGIFRIDLLLVTVIQVAVALVAYLLWPNMDRRAIDAMIQSKARTNPAKRKSISKRFMVTYVLLSLFVVAAQVGSLLVYKVPPQLYDLFSESRALKYELNEEGDGYIVSYVYAGTSPLVNIPATYNNKPVVGIREGAIRDDNFVEKHKITEITFGTPSKDEEGNTIIVSNLQYLEANAITNNNIETLSLPDSLVSIGKDAIVSSSLKTLTYQSRAQFNALYLSSCSALEKIVMEGDNVGTIVSLEGLNATTQIEVAKDIYNKYRKENFNYISAFEPIMEADEFCIDFYTNDDYYINSIIRKIDDPVQLRYTDLKGDEAQGVSPVVDTLAYIENKNELGTQGAKEASAFRGWYKDPNFEEEVEFTKDGFVSIASNTTLYAKWIEEYTGTLNWGTFKPTDAPSQVYWTAEDTTAFPVIENRTGYSKGVQWRVAGSEDQVYDSTGVLKNITLDATWLLDKPVIDINNQFIGNGLSVENDEIEYTYDESYSIKLLESHSHGLDNFNYNGVDTTYSYYWTKEGDDFTSIYSSINLDQVADSGTYKLGVTINSPFGESASAETEVTLTINRKPIDMGSVILADNTDSLFYNGALQELEYTGTLGSDNIKVTYNYYNAAGELANINEGVINAGEYSVVAKFEKDNQAEAANYQTKSLTASFTIFPKALIFEGWAGNGTDWTDNSVVYDGTDKQYKMQFSGVLPNDTVDLTYEENSHTGKNAGSYTSIVTGLTNANYALSEEMKNQSTKGWTITQRQVTVQTWQVDDSDWTGSTVVYDGKAHGVYAVMNGTVLDEDVTFTYSSDPQYVNSATNAAQYSAKIIGVSDENYFFDVSSGDAQFAWEITPRPLSVQYTTQNLTYNGQNQGINVTIGNFVSTELASFDISMFDFSGKTASVVVEEVGRSTEQATITLSNKALNADTYTAKVAGLNNSVNTALLNNYSLTAASQTFTIQQRELTVAKDVKTYVYNGLEQDIFVYVTNILATDLDSFAFNQFTTGATSGALTAEAGELDTENNRVKLTYKAKNAGSYVLSVDSFANGNNNYKLSEAKSDTFNIAKATITVTGWNLKDKTQSGTGTNFEPTDVISQVYNYAGYIVTPIYTGMQNGETVDLTLASSEQKDVADYTTTASLDTVAYPNYAMTTVSKDWKITPYTVNFTWTVSDQAKNSFVYDRVEKTVAPVYSLLGDDTTTITYQDTAQLKKTDKGDYTVKATALSNANYQLGSGTTFAWSITARPVELSWTGLTHNYTYDGTYTAVATVDNVCDGDTVTVSAYKSVKTSAYGLINENSNSTNRAGEYTVTAVTLSNANYTLEGVADAVKTMSVARQQVTIVWGDDADLEYNGQIRSLTATVKGKTDGQIVPVSYGITLNDETVGSAIGAGTYTFTVTTLTNENYILGPESEAPTSCDLTIKPRPVTLSWSGLTDIVYNGKARTVTASVTNKALSSDAFTITYDKNTYTDADTYEVTVTGLGNANYTLVGGTAVSTDFTIKPLPVQLKWSGASVYYNGEALQATATVNNKALAEDSFAIEYDNNTYTNVGTRTVTVTGLGNSNYTLTDATNVSTTFVINKLPVEITWNAPTVVFDSLEHKAVATVSNKATGDLLTVTYNANTYTNAGTYTVTVTGLEGEDADNYTLTNGRSLSTSLIIQKQPVQITWSNDTYTYDATAHTPTATIVGANDGKPVAGTLSTASTQTVAGTHTARVQSLSDNNYTLDGVSNVTHNLVIKQKVVELVWAWDNTTQQEFTYDGKSHKLVATVTNVSGSDSVTVNKYSAVKTSDYGSIVASSNATTYAGAYDITATGLSNANYTLGGTTAETETLVIKQQKVSVVWGNNAEFIYKGSAYMPNVTIKGASDNIDVAVTYAITQNTATMSSAIDAGTYNFAIETVNNTNYTLVGVMDELDCDLIIKPRPVTFTWTGTAVTYNGTSREVTAAVNNVQRSTDKFTITYDDNTYTNAGTYTVTVTGIGNANYTLTDATYASTSFVINKLPVQLTWNTSTLTYNGKVQTLTAIVSNKISTDSITLTYNANAYKDAGSRTVTVTELSNENYTLTGASNVSTTFVINALPVQLTWAGTSAEYNGQEHTATATVANLKEGDTVNLTYDENTYINVGNHAIRVTAVDNTNYTVTGGSALSATLKITAQKVVITWSNTTFTYDGTAHTPTVTVKGATDGEAVSYTLSSASTQTNARATAYTATVASLTNSNYTLTGVSNLSTSFVINPQKVNIAWSNTSFTYDGSSHKPTATVTGATDGKSVSCTLSTESTQTNADTYTATVVSLGNTNYTLTDVSGTTTSFTIAPQKVSITWSNTTFTYDGTAHAPTATVKGATDGKAIGCTLSTASSKTNASATPYTATVASLTNSNYTLEDASNASTEFTINPQKVTIVWSNTTHTYDKTAKKLSVSVKGVTDGKTVTYNLSGNTGTNAGTYNVTLTLNNSNYTLTGATGATSQDLVINKRPVSFTWKWDGSAQQSFTYDGNAHTLTAVAGNVITGDTVTVSYNEATSYTNAGTYSVSIKGISNDNYSFTSESKSITINKRAVTFNWKWDSGAEKTFTYDGKAHTLTATVGNVISGDTVTATYNEATSYTNAGTYKVSIKGISNTSNYSFTTESKSITINPYKVSITWSNTSVTYDGNAHSVNVSVKGVGGAAVAYTLSANSYTDAGTYTVTVTSLSNANYTLDGVSNTSTKFTISPKLLTLTWTLPANKVANGTVKTFSAEANNKVAGDTISFTYSIKNEKGQVVTSIIEAGTYTITITGITGTDSGNYTVVGSSTASRQLTIIASA